MNYAGIDYGFGRTNVDDAGIRYGVLSASNESLVGWFWEQVETVYTPHCPKCGIELECDDIGCADCDAEFEDYECYGDECDAMIINVDGIQGQIDSNNDIWIFKSPHFTYAQFCSPCAPGACYLASPLHLVPTGHPRAYCLGPDWFDGKAPYPIYSVETDQRIDNTDMRKYGDTND